MHKILSDLIRYSGPCKIFWGRVSCFCHAMQHPEAILLLCGAPTHSQGPKEQRDNAGTGQEVRSQEEHSGVYAGLSPLTIWVGT